METTQAKKEKGKCTNDENVEMDVVKLEKIESKVKA